MQNRSAEFFKVMTKYLYKHKMSFRDCDIVEHTLLRLAGVNTMPRKSITSISKDNKERITIKIADLNEKDVSRFILFLQKHDVTALLTKTSEKNYFYFDIDGQAMLQNFFPLIQAEIEKSEKENSQILEPYINDSKNDWNVNNSFGSISKSRISGAALAMLKICYPSDKDPIKEEDMKALDTFIMEHTPNNGSSRDIEPENISKNTSPSLSPLVQQNIFSNSSRDAQFNQLTTGEIHQDQKPEIQEKLTSYTPR